MEVRRRRSFGNGNKPPQNRNAQFDFEQVKLQVKKVSMTTKGGRRPHFACLTLVKKRGEEEFSIGIAYAKGSDFPSAISKSSRKATKNLTTFWEGGRRTIPYELIVKYNATKILLKPAPEGCGVKAGSVVRIILGAVGIKDVSCKIIGSRNKINVTRCLVKALNRYTDKKMSF